MSEFHVYRSYRNLFAGRPTENFNRKVIARARETAEEFWPGWPVCVIPPHYTQREGPDPRNPEGRVLWEELPQFVCLSCFQSFETTDPEKHVSILIVVWWQEHSPFVELPFTQPEFQQIDWAVLAKNFEY